MRFFIDSSALFAMADSSQGAAREILRYSLVGSAELVLSDFVLEETQAKLTRKKPRAVEILYQIQRLNLWQIVNPSEDEIRIALDYVCDPDDAPIIAAARKAKVDALISFDRKHLHTKVVASFVGAPTLTAGDALSLMLFPPPAQT